MSADVSTTSTSKYFHTTALKVTSAISLTIPRRYMSVVALDIPHNALMSGSITAGCGAEEVEQTHTVKRGASNHGTWGAQVPHLVTAVTSDDDVER